MEVQFGPNSIDEPSLLYKLQRKIKVFNVNDSLPNRGYNLVASSSKYGLVFVAVPDGTLSVYQLNQLIDKECEPQHLSVQLQEKPTHIAVNCDYELLAVAGCRFLTVYKVVDFQTQNVSPSFSIQTNTVPTNNPPYVSALQWNPCISDSIAIAYSDGSLLACLANSGQVKKAEGRARCICWSPKGKQLVTGNSDGTLVQYKPELTATKLVHAPNLFEGAPVEAMAIYWISTFQFAVVYRNAADNSRPAVTIVNTPKTGQRTCISYEDICYSMGSNRPWYYYLQGLPQWNIIMTSSSNSMELGTLGSTDGENWLQWNQNDEARPELPLTDKKIENYPVGLSVDTCAIHQLPWGENETLPHMPLLHVISQNGLLTTFNIINLKKEATQVCTPPQLLALPAQAMTSAIPGELAAAPPPATIAAPIIPKPEPAAPVQQAQPASVVQPAPPSVNTVTATIKIPNFIPQTSQVAFAATTGQQLEQKQSAESLPVTITATLPKPQPQHQPQLQPQPQSQAQPQPQPPSAKPQTQENAALKAEQEKASKAKANQELKDMLVKEVNDFQTELYNFMVKTRETQARLQRDIDSISTNFNGMSLDTEELKKECSMEELRGAIVQLKLELVRACAVVAEARTHADAKDLHQWSQADPLTTKRVASVKKLAYYVQTQLAQAHAALDYKWNEMASRDADNNKPGTRMIRPILDDVYQPLVKQQEILCRQQAVLRTLKSTLVECDVGPVFKSTSLLRSTPFKNNKDPLSKLTKNILNMSLEPETKPKRQLLTPSKLDALRDVLSNHKTVKIKPVNVELRQHLETLKKSYEKSVKEKAEKVQSVPPSTKMVKITMKPEPASQPAATFTPVVNVKPAPAPTSVIRTLFTDAPKPETTVPQTVTPRPVSKPLEPPSTVEAAVPNTKSVLKDVLTNRQANLDAKNNSNTFMGQKICSPAAFSQPSAPTPSSAPSAVFTSKPIVDINTKFNKFQPQPFVLETKSTSNTRQTDQTTLSISKIKSSETGEPDDSPKPKPMTNLFGMKPPLAASTPQVGAAKTSEPKPAASKPLEKATEKAKENVPKPAPKVVEKKETKPLTSQASKGFVFGASQSNEAGSSIASSKPAVTTDPQQGPEKSNAAGASPSSIFASANASITTSKQSAFTTPSTANKTEPGTPTNSSSTSEPSSTSSSASSIFGGAVASPPKTTTSIFSSPTTVLSSIPSTVVFGSTSTALESTSATQALPVLNKTAITSADSTFEPVSTSQTTFSSTASVQSITTAHPQPMKPQTAANSVGSIFKPVSQSSSETTVSEATTTASFGSSSVTVKSVFGSGTSAFGAATSTTASIFGSAAPSIPATVTTASIFGSISPSVTTTTSVFGSASPSVATTTVASVFGATSPDVAITTTASVFGSSTPSVVSVFGATTTSSSPVIFGSTQSSGAFTPTTSLFGGTTQASSVFAQATQSVFGTTTQASIFGAGTPSSIFSSTSQPSVFGSSPTTQASVFGSPTQTNQTSIFGTSTATTQASVFGASTQASSVFGSPTQTSQVSVFGTPTQTTQASVFGTPTQTTPASVFGTPTQTTQASVFGTPTQTTPSSVFGTPTQTTQVSVFGTPTQTTQASIFGTPTQTTQASIFGTPTQTTQASVFGTPTTQASIFGQPAANVQNSGSLFGGGEANLFAAASISTTNASAPGSGGNIFGSSSGSVFGGSPNVFGGKGTFGQSNPTAASIFGGGAAFGQKPATNIWGSGSTSNSGFGSGGFGQSATTQASSIFGGSTGGSFSQPSAGAFGSSPQQSAFGSPTQQAPAFGGGSVFAAKPQFGQPAGFGSPGGSGFGSPAAFGGFNKSPGGSAFGSPAFGGGSTFGGGSPGGFSAPTQSNATFESLATQNTLTFGNLAHQSGSPPPAAPSLNTSPSFTGWRG